MKFGQGGTDQERGMEMCGPEDPFHASPEVRKGPIWSKNVSSKGPLLRKFRNCSLYSLNVCPTFNPQDAIWKFSAHKPLNLETFSSQAPNLEIFSSQAPSLSEANISSQAPHFGNPGRTPLPEKKLSAPRCILLLFIIIYVITTISTTTITTLRGDNWMLLAHRP